MVFTVGLTAENMKGIISMTRRMDRESIHGVMVGSTVVSGKMESSMDRVFTVMQMAIVVPVCGMRVGVQCGSTEIYLV